MRHGSSGWIHVGREPVYDAAGSGASVFGYELTFRTSDSGGESGGASGGPADTSEASVTRLIMSTFTEFGLHALVGRRHAFVNLTQAFLTGELPVPLPAERAVLVVPAGAHGHPRVVDGARRLLDEGYEIGARVTAEASAAAAGLLALAGYVKLDAGALLSPTLAGGPGGQALVGELRRVAGRARLVAENVTTPRQRDACQELGIDYLQGPLLAQPDTVTARTLTPSQVATLRLMARLNQPEVGLREVEDLVKQDPALSLRVLRAANTAHAALSRRISSVRDALVLLGLRQLRAWLLLMMVGDASAASEEQLSSAMTRARACELLAPRVAGCDRDAAFLAGLLTSLADLLAQPLDTFAADLPLDEGIRAALLTGDGPLGALLGAVIAYDRGDLAALGSGPVDQFDMSRAFLEAVGWSLQTCESVFDY